jgi:hypothetical protein
LPTSSESHHCFFYSIMASIYSVIFSTRWRFVLWKLQAACWRMLRKCIFFGELWGLRNIPENTSVDGIIILKFNFKNWNRVFDWIDLTQERDRWLAEDSSIYQEGLCSMKLVVEVCLVIFSSFLFLISLTVRKRNIYYVCKEAAVHCRICGWWLPASEWNETVVPQFTFQEFGKFEGKKISAKIVCIRKKS